MCLAFIANAQFLASPEVVSTSGGYGETESGLKVSWTLGETITETFTNETISLTLGFQQSSYNIIIKPESISSLKYFSNLKVYPNPVTSFFYIYIEIKENKELKLLLCGIEGKQLLIQPIINGRNIVYLPSNNSGAIIGKIMNSKSEHLKSFQLIKK